MLAPTKNVCLFRGGSVLVPCWFRAGSIQVPCWFRVGSVLVPSGFRLGPVLVPWCPFRVTFPSISQTPHFCWPDPSLPLDRPLTSIRLPEKDGTEPTQNPDGTMMEPARNRHGTNTVRRHVTDLASLGI